MLVLGRKMVVERAAEGGITEVAISFRIIK